jgi:hypothetical protein
VHCVFRMILKMKSDIFPKQHELVLLCNGHLICSYKVRTENVYNEHVHSIEYGEARQRNFKKHKLGGDQAYDGSSG